jgi:FkbM family methyltransferase
MDLVLQLTIYKHTIPEYQALRREEFIQCFQRNLNLSFINRIHIFVETEEDKYYYTQNAGNMISKCVFTVFGRQPTYSDLVEYVQSHIENNTIVCITNSDIFLTENFNITLVDYLVRDNVMLGLTRHEPTDTTHTVCNIETCNLIHKYIGSHDTFIMRTPLIDIDKSQIEHKQNVWGAEAVFQKTLRDAGYTLLNPAYQIQVFHHHRDQDWLKKNYPIIATETTFSNPPSRVDIDIHKLIKYLPIKRIVEIGAHFGTDTERFHDSHPNAEIISFEPDPRNLRMLKERGVDKIASIQPYAISDKNGSIAFHLSSGNAPSECDNLHRSNDWSASSSIKQPTGHLTLHPWVEFKNKIKVKTKRLDDVEELQDKSIDFMWVDVQGAEDLVFSGAKETLNRTRYVFTEYCNHELYSGQLPLNNILSIFGKNWEIVHDFHSDVLLYNKNFNKTIKTQTISKKLLIYVVFHKALYDQCYNELTEDEFSCLRFIAVNEHIEKTYTYKNVIKEWELPIYNPYYQSNGYNENSVLKHIYDNNLIESEYIGFVQYDMIFPKNSINQILQLLNPETCVSVYSTSYQGAFVNTAVDSERQIINKIPFLYDAFFKTKSIPNKRYPLLNSYIVHSDVYRNAMPFVDCMLTILNPMHGNMGGIFERVFAYTFGQLTNVVQSPIQDAHGSLKIY